MWNLTYFYFVKSVRLPMLTVLKLDNCDGITSASMVAVSNSTMLEVWISFHAYGGLLLVW